MRHEPKTNFRGALESRVRITLGGKGEPASGHLLSPSRRTSSGDAYQGVVVTLDVEGAGATPQNLNLAGGIRLDPDGRLREASVAQQRAENELRHYRAASPVRATFPNCTTELLPTIKQKDTPTVVREPPVPLRFVSSARESRGSED
jgi:hypothetical protein